MSTLPGDCQRQIVFGGAGTAFVRVESSSRQERRISGLRRIGCPQIRRMRSADLPPESLAIVSRRVRRRRVNTVWFVVLDRGQIHTTRPIRPGRNLSTRVQPGVGPYKQRNVVERASCRRREYRVVATRQTSHGLAAREP